MFQNFQTQNYAGFWIRFAAYLIDTIILSFVFVPLGIAIGFLAYFSAGSTENADAFSLLSVLVRIIEIIAGWLYFAGLESSSWQATLGKKACGLVVTDLNGQRIGFGNATGRYFGKILSGLILGIGFLMIAFTDKKQGLHDQIASTLVLKGPVTLTQPAPPPPPDFSERASEFTAGQWQ